MFLLSLWISLMVMLAYYLTITLGNLLGGMTIVCLLNMSLLFMVLHYLKRDLKRMSFEKSRALLSQTGNTDHDFTH
jgi:hypothetical protein